MSEKPPFTEEQWVKYKQDRKLMYVECEDCRAKTCIPNPRCNVCGSTKLLWKESQGTGNIYTYTITFVPPPHLAAIAPYVAAVVTLEEGVRINGIINGVSNIEACPDDLIGKPVKLDFLELDGTSVIAFKLA